MRPRTRRRPAVSTDPTPQSSKARKRPLAAEQFLGYSLQVNRMLWYLLNATPDGFASLEVLGDVALTDSSGTTSIEEIKSRTGDANPVANRAVDLWKTLYNWYVAVSSKRVDPMKTTFILHTNAPFSGSIVQSFHDTQDRGQARDSIAAAERELFPTDGARESLAQTLKPYVDALFAPPARDDFAAIVEHFRLQHGSPISETELLQALRMKAIGDEVADLVLVHLLGWLKTKVDKSIATSQAVIVSSQDFRTELVALARKFDRQQLLASFAPATHSSDVARRHLSSSTYIEQLDLIESSEEDKLGAVADYLSAEADRIAWAERGLIHSSTFDELEKQLTAAWRSYRTRVSVQCADRSECDRGKLLFADCCLHRITVQSMEPPGHFCRGSFHALADTRQIGWHPRFNELLRSRKEQ